MEDREMIRRIQHGQKEYLNQIAEKYYDDIYYFCCYQTGSREDAYDLAQDTFLRFIRYVDNYKYQNLKGYLLTIAMNLCRNYIRCKARTPDCAKIITEEMQFPENSLLLSDALRALPEPQREAVLLHHFYGYKNWEIARMTGASCAAVKSRIKQGLTKLEKTLNKEDFYGL
ncbi:MAG: RNA polymerase sigma factor [Eubacterium sp.]|nr:RNA polymerase sigma factor [Eubacterium sp.]